MRSRFAIPAAIVGISVAAAAFSAPASAQYVYGPGYYGPGPYGPVYAPRISPYYYGGPATAPLFYGDGWVPYPIYQHSRPGGYDPYFRPPGS